MRVSYWWRVQRSSLTGRMRTSSLSRFYATAVNGVKGEQLCLCLSCHSALLCSFENLFLPSTSCETMLRTMSRNQRITAQYKTQCLKALTTPHHLTENHFLVQSLIRLSKVVNFQDGFPSKDAFLLLLVLICFSICNSLRRRRAVVRRH